MTTTFDVTMPQLGETVSEGTVVGWLVDLGATIAAGDALLEVSTDKVDTELPSPVTGVVTEITAVAGETVAVGATLGRIAVEGDAWTQTPQLISDSPPAASAAPVPAPPAPVPSPSPAAREHPRPVTGTSVAPTGGTRLRVSPVARRLAADQHIDLASLTGTGDGGAVVKRDIELMSNVRDTSSRAPRFVGTQAASLLEASVQVELDAVDSTGATHAIAAYTMRAIVDTLRTASRHHDDLLPLVETSVMYIHAPSGRTVALPGAAGLRLSGLTSRLEAPAEPDELKLADAAVTILDCTELPCSISGAMSGALTVSIGPRKTVPTLSADTGRVAIIFRDVCLLSIGVDGSVVSVQALSAIAQGVKHVVETRDWNAEL